MAESAARQVQDSPESATRMVDSICHAMDENFDEIQMAADEEPPVPSIFMTTERNHHETPTLASGLEASSDEEDSNVLYEELSKQALHHRQNADQESSLFFALTFHLVAMEGRTTSARNVTN
jgi:hypothetical protein